MDRMDIRLPPDFFCLPFRGNDVNLSAKPPFTVIAKPVRTLAVAIRTPVLFPLRLKMDEKRIATTALRSRNDGEWMVPALS